MVRASSVDVLPEEIQSEIGRLFMQGCTIDQIVAHLRSMHGVTSVSRSAMGRHVKGLSEVVERLRSARMMATAMKAELGDAPESDAARFNVEMLQTSIFDLMRKQEEGEQIDPKTIFQLAQSMNHLAKASSTNADFLAKVERRAEERTKKEAVVAVEAVTKARGISSETADAIKAAIFGVKAETPAVAHG